MPTCGCVRLPADPEHAQAPGFGLPFNVRSRQRGFKPARRFRRGYYHPVYSKTERHARTEATEPPTTMARKSIFKVVFHNQGKIYELYARHVSHGEIYGFIEVDDIVFGERTAILVDPSEERLKAEFAGVKRTFIPLHAVIRIDQVDKEGVAKVLTPGESGANVTPFPLPMYQPPGGDKSST